jgi:hypothetical protein
LDELMANLVHQVAAAATGGCTETSTSTITTPTPVTTTTATSTSTSAIAGWVTLLAILELVDVDVVREDAACSIADAARTVASNVNYVTPGEAVLLIEAGGLEIVLNWVEAIGRTFAPDEFSDTTDCIASQVLTQSIEIFTAQLVAKAAGSLDAAEGVRSVQNGGSGVLSIAWKTSPARTTAGNGEPVPTIIGLQVQGATVTVPIPSEDGAVGSGSLRSDVLVVMHYPLSNITKSLFSPTDASPLADAVLVSAVVSVSRGGMETTPAAKLNGNATIALEVATAYEDVSQAGESDGHGGYFTCVWWVFAADLAPNPRGDAGEEQPQLEDGGWSDAGCMLVDVKTDQTNTTTVTCSCTHLTHFAVLFTDSDSEANRDESLTKVLTGITNGGAALEVLAIFATFATFIAFSDLVKRPEWIIVNLCIAVIVGHLMFITCTSRKEWQSDASCTATAASIQYFLLASWTWQIVEAEHLYVVFVEVMSEHASFWWYHLVGWGAPLLFVIPSVLVYHDDYGYTAADKQQLCWIDPDSNANYLYGALFSTAVCI